jgi:hypothetical protein
MDEIRLQGIKVGLQGVQLGLLAPARYSLSKESLKTAESNYILSAPLNLLRCDKIDVRHAKVPSADDATALATLHTYISIVCLLHAFSDLSHRAGIVLNTVHRVQRIRFDLSHHFAGDVEGEGF